MAAVEQAVAAGDKEMKIVDSSSVEPNSQTAFGNLKLDQSSSTILESIKDIEDKSSVNGDHKESNESVESKDGSWPTTTLVTETNNKDHHNKSTLEESHKPTINEVEKSVDRNAVSGSDNDEKEKPAESSFTKSTASQKDEKRPSASVSPASSRTSVKNVTESPKKLESPEKKERIITVKPTSAKSTPVDGEKKAKSTSPEKAQAEEVKKGEKGKAEEAPAGGEAKSETQVVEDVGADVVMEKKKDEEEKMETDEQLGEASGGQVSATGAADKVAAKAKGRPKANPKSATKPKAPAGPRQPREPKPKATATTSSESPRRSTRSIPAKPAPIKVSATLKSAVPVRGTKRPASPAAVKAAPPAKKATKSAAAVQAQTASSKVKIVAGTATKGVPVPGKRPAPAKASTSAAASKKGQNGTGKSVAAKKGSRVQPQRTPKPAVSGRRK